MAFLPGQIGAVPDALLTPDQVARKREEAALYAQQAMGGGAQNFLGALVQGLSGFQGGRMLSQADKAEAAGLASADEFVQGIPQISGGPVAPAPQSAGVPAALAGLPQEARSAPGADYIRAGLVQRGLPEHVADAFILNFQDESGLNPGINEANPIVEGSRGGFGLAQWTGPRRRQLEAFAAQRGTPVSDVDTQLDFLMTELQGPESAAAKKILSAGDTGSAASAIVNSFLRPAEEHRARREARYLGGATPQFSAAPTQPQSQDLSALIQASSNPWVAQKYGPAVDALLQQDMERSNAAYESQLKQQDPMYQAQLQGAELSNLSAANELDRQSQGLPSGDVRVQSSEILPDGTTALVMSDGTPRIVSPTGQVLQGQDAADAIRAAREYGVQNQREVYGGRREGTLGADIALGGEAQGVKDIASATVDTGMKSWEDYGKLQSSIGTIDEAIAAIDSGAKAGMIYNMLPNVTESSASLQNAMDRMGLDVIGSVTFGALSEGEMKLAMETAVPRNLQPAELRNWLVRKREAQAKASEMLADAAQYMTVPGNTINGWIEKNRAARQESQPSESDGWQDVGGIRIRRKQ